MKQSLIILTFLFCYYTGTSQNKNYQQKFTYKFSFKPYKNKEMVLKQEMILLVGKNESFFFSKQKIILDSLRKEYKNDVYAFIEIKRKLPKNYINFIISKDFNKRQYIYQNKYLTDVYKYSEKMPKLNWHLLKKYKTILGYSCQLATVTFKGRNYLAWFSKDIPIQEGPYKFIGLPGLILDIYDVEKVLHFTIIGIKNKNHIFPDVFDKKAFVIDKKNETKFKLGVEKNIIGRLIGPTALTVKKKLEDLKKYANHIELE